MSHHPPDPNDGVVRGRLDRSAMLAAAITAAVTVGGAVWFAVVIGGAR